VNIDVINFQKISARRFGVHGAVLPCERETGAETAYPKRPLTRRVAKTPHAAGSRVNWAGFGRVPPCPELGPVFCRRS